MQTGELAGEMMEVQSLKSERQDLIARIDHLERMLDSSQQRSPAKVQSHVKDSSAPALRSFETLTPLWCELPQMLWSFGIY